MTILSGTDIVDLQKIEVKCVALGPPPVYRAYRIDKRFRDHIKIFINQNDVVPRLSLHTISRLFETVRSIDKLDLKTVDIIKILTNAKDLGSIESVEMINM